MIMESAKGHSHFHLSFLLFVQISFRYPREWSLIFRFPPFCCTGPAQENLIAVTYSHVVSDSEPMRTIFRIVSKMCFAEFCYTTPFFEIPKFLSCFGKNESINQLVHKTWSTLRQ